MYSPAITKTVRPEQNHWAIVQLRIFAACSVLLSLGACATAPTSDAVHNSPDLKPEKKIISSSRAATVEVSSVSGNSKGTGFIIGRRHIVTCFHVVARVTQREAQTHVEMFGDIKVKLSTGDVLSGTVVSIPSPQSPEPIIRDFAIIELPADIPSALVESILEVVAAPTFEIGDTVYFSGYPLATPAMVTHKGLISGFDSKSSIICIQGSINKGNSGGALCDENGRVIGIVSYREGGIAVGLSELNAYIDSTSKQGSVAIMGVDPLQAIKAISQTLDTYISTGIGYAHSTVALKMYLDARPELKK